MKSLQVYLGRKSLCGGAQHFAVRVGKIWYEIAGKQAGTDQRISVTEISTVMASLFDLQDPAALRRLVKVQLDVAPLEKLLSTLMHALVEDREAAARREKQLRETEARVAVSNLHGDEIVL